MDLCWREDSEYLLDPWCKKQGEQFNIVHIYIYEFF